MPSRGQVGARLAQGDPRQFGGATEPQREAWPQRGTVVHVERHPVDVVTTRNVAGVGTCGQPVDPQNQSSVRVSGQLQSHAELRGVPRVARLMIEQDDRGAFGSAFEDCGKVADGMSSAARRPVCDAGEDQLSSAVRAQVIDTIKVIDDQRAKSATTLATDDHTAATAMNPIADLIATATVAKLPGKFAPG